MVWILAVLAALALVVAVRRGAAGALTERFVRRRLGGYRHRAVAPRVDLPGPVQGVSPRVAVVGGGLAGIGAAATLAERKVEVTLLERNEYLGGKIGAWKSSVGNGEQTVDHGFHAFFRQYYNLNRFLDRLGLREGFCEIEDYLIIDRNDRHWTFGDVATQPVLNIIDLGRRGFYRLGDMVSRRTRTRMESFVRFDMDETYARWDDVTFDRFCDDAALPDELRVSFRTFARAFFSDGADLSTADVLRAFHFYYLSHDHGLMYDYPLGDYETTLLTPIRKYLERHGVDVRLGAETRRIECGEQRRFRIGDEEYDWIVLAADIPGAQRVIAGSPWLRDEAPRFVSDIEALRTSNGYAIWRIWVDRDVRPGLPTFINVDRLRVLDSVTLYHRITDEARQWATEHEGAVLELHSYALPPDVQAEADVRRVFLEELARYFPETTNLVIHAEALQVRHDFPAFAPGQRAHRPSPKTPVPGLLMAGDWVKLPYPMTHMEAAFTSGLVCANVIFDELGLRQAPIDCVAPKGILPPRARNVA